tara:strand:- start:857 stop:1639 length:783 start_codon:yes stop_codon:yes gene_type:complete
MKRIVIGFSKTAPANSVCSASEKEIVLEKIKEAIQTHTNVEVIKLNEENGEVLWVRDLYFMLEGHCVICNCTQSDSIMKDRSRERNTILPLIEGMGYPIIKPPDSVHLEGGDIIQNGNDVFVGINQRTNLGAVQFLKWRQGLEKINFIPVRHSDMHLDCVMTVVKNTIFYSKRRVNEQDFLWDLRAVVSRGYDLIDIDDETDGILSTNILIIGDHIFHSDRIQNTKIIRHLADMGLNIHTIPYGRLWEEGGGVRCLTQEL